MFYKILYIPSMNSFISHRDKQNNRYSHYVRDFTGIMSSPSNSSKKMAGTGQEMLAVQEYVCTSSSKM